MINILIYLAIILLCAAIAYGAIFINYEVSKEKKEVKRMNTNLQAEVSRLKACCNNHKKLDSIYISEDKIMSNCKRTMLVNLLRKIINNLYDLSDNHLVEYNDIERTINLAKTAESIISKGENICQ